MGWQVHSTAPVHSRECTVCTEAIGHLGQAMLPPVRMPEFPTQPCDLRPPLPCVLPPLLVLLCGDLGYADYLRGSTKPGPTCPRPRHPHGSTCASMAGLFPITLFPEGLHTCNQEQFAFVRTWGKERFKMQSCCSIICQLDLQEAMGSNLQSSKLQSKLFARNIRFEALRSGVELIVLPVGDRNANGVSTPMPQSELSAQLLQPRRALLLSLPLPVPHQSPSAGTECSAPTSKRVQKARSAEK